MKRHVELKDISDGKLYTANDMAKLGCNGCLGCSACCRGMGSSIVLDPMDMYCLTSHLNAGFESLLQDRIELNVVDGIILPNLKMAGREECCTFLDSEGRCGIHKFRPGVCRLFPLGRYYENHSFRYFLQTRECKRENRSKVKIKKWMDLPDLNRYEQFVTDWHYFLNDCEAAVARAEESLAKKWNLYLLNQFYVSPYGEEDFYSQFYQRLEEAKAIVR